MKNLTKIILLVAVAVSAACQRQELENKLYVNALIPIQIDWANSGLDIENESGDTRSWDLYSTSVWLFPTSESTYQGAPLEFVLSNTDTKALTKADAKKIDFIEVPVGIYKMIIFNRSVAEFNLTGDYVGFNTGSFDSFEYYALESSGVHQQPEPLASWSYGVDGETFEVTVDMVYMYDAVEAIKNEHYGTESKSVDDVRADLATLDASLTPFVFEQDVVPTSVTRDVTIKQHVTNLHNVSSAKCTITGMSRSVFLATQKCGSQTATHVVAYTIPSLGIGVTAGYMDTSADTETKVTTMIPMPKATTTSVSRVEIPTAINDVTVANVYYLSNVYKPEEGDDSETDDEGYTKDNIYDPQTAVYITDHILAQEQSIETGTEYEPAIIGGEDDNILGDTTTSEAVPEDVKDGSGGGFDVEVPSWGDDVTVDIPSTYN